MSQSQPFDSHWTYILKEAAEHLDGGTRSFPLTSEGGFMRHYAYDPPDERYQKLFFRQATVSSSQPDALFCSHSAGWLIPDDASDCKPVFIAHSTLSAIWLLRETLPQDTLPNNAWASLVSAAHSLTQDSQELPPSAQKPRDATPTLSKRPALSSLASSSKRVRTEVEPQSQAAQDVPHAASLQPSEISEPEEPLQEEPAHVTTVTNNNRRAELMRTRKLASRQLQKKLNLGLVSPSDKAARQEKIAYESIPPQDEPNVAWIIKQDTGNGDDFYATARSPYATATSMLERARTLGNPTAQSHAAAFLQTWRARGSPFPSASSPATQMVLQERNYPTTQASVDDEAFCYAYNLVDHYEQRLAAVHIEYRWAMALLGRAYANKIAGLQKEDQVAKRGKHQSRGGKGHLRTEAIAALLRLLYPKESKITEANKAAFKHRLHRANRWYEAADALGWGCLCLMPHDMSPFWVEKTLRVGEWRIWLELAKKVNPDAHAASMALDSWLGSEGIAGGPISSKERLCIEAEAPAITNQVEEIQDSDEDEEDLAPSQSQATPQSIAPARPLRQRSLLELFNPQQ